MKRLIILNGPPGSGKDYLADALVSLRKGVTKVEFKTQLRKLVKLIYGLTDEEHDIMYQRKNKESPQKKLRGLSIREAYIFVSEKVIKPIYGHTYFGEFLAGSLTEDGVTYVCSDGGFQAEILPCVDACDRIDIVQLFAEGCSFEGDSRNYINLMHKKIVHHKLTNDFTPEVVEKLIKDVYES